MHWSPAAMFACHVCSGKALCKFAAAVPTAVCHCYCISTGDYSSLVLLPVYLRRRAANNLPVFEITDIRT